MPEPKKTQIESVDANNEVAQAARERELQDLIARVEAEKNGSVRPSNESPNDFIDRKMRENLGK